MKRTGLDHEKGFTLVELIAALLIMAVLGTMAYTLLKTSSSTYSIIDSGQYRSREARIALSYISVKLRQNDTMYGFAVQDAGRMLTLYDSDGGTAWQIYLDTSADRLMERKGDIGAPVKIAELNHSINQGDPGVFSRLDKNTVRITLKYRIDDDSVGTVTGDVTLRSDVQSP